MSQAIPLIPTARSNTESPALSRVLRMLAVAGVVSAAGGVVVTALWLSRLDAAARPGPVPAPAALAVATTAASPAGSTTVPDASAVFSQREPEPEPEPEVPSPTF